MNKNIVYLVLSAFGLSIYAFDINKDKKEFKKSLETFIFTNDAPSKKNPEIHKEVIDGKTCVTETYYDKSSVLRGIDTYDAYREINYEPKNIFEPSAVTLSNFVKLIDYSVLDKKYIERLEMLLTDKIQNGGLQGSIFFGSTSKIALELTSKIELDVNKTLIVKFPYKSGLDKAVKDNIENKEWQALQDLLMQHVPTVRLKIRIGFKWWGRGSNPSYHVVGIDRMLEDIVHKLKG